LQYPALRVGRNSLDNAVEGVRGCALVVLDRFLQSYDVDTPSSSSHSLHSHQTTGANLGLSLVIVSHPARPSTFAPSSAPNYPNPSPSVSATHSSAYPTRKYGRNQDGFT
jgi:hypothetical protein